MLVGLVPAELLVGQNQPLQPDGEADVTAGHHVLDLKLQKASRESQLLDHPCVLPSRQSRLLLTAWNAHTNFFDDIITSFELHVRFPPTDLLAPVQTIFPELKMSAVVLGSRILMMTAAKR